MEGLSFNTKIGYDDIQKQFEYLTEKQRSTIKLLCNGSFGIVSEYNTSNENSTLIPTISGNTLSISKGNLVTKKGDFVEIESFNVTVPNIIEDNIILYTYELVGSNEKRISNSGLAYPIRYVKKEDSYCLKFLTLAQYNSLSEQVIHNSVCLGILKFSTSGNYIDLTKSEYSFNRPWFSLCDISHRQQKGTGSSTVPHSIGLNDLTSSNLTIYDQLLTRGMIVSKDYGIAGVPGTLYSLGLDSNPVKITEQDSKYIINLGDCYPNAIGSVYLKENTNREVACHLIKGSNTIVVDEEENLTGQDVIVQICVTNTLMPISDGNVINEISFRTKDSNDVIISQGLQIELNSSSVSFKDCSNFVKMFEAVVNKDGTIHKEPELLGSASSVNSLVTSDAYREFDIPVRFQLLKIRSGSTNTSIKFIGKDSSGNDIEETLTLTNNESSLSGFTENYFSVLERIESGDESQDTTIELVVFAYSDRASDRRVRIAHIEYDGINSTITVVNDIRPISTVVKDPFKLSYAREAALNLINSINIKESEPKALSILVEDFSCPQFLDLNSVTWITSTNGINFPLIPKYIVNSSSYLSCYRSRRIKICDGDSSSHKIYAYLVGADENTVNNNPVRLIIADNDYIMNPEGNGLYSYTIQNPSESVYGKVVVTGRASAIALFEKV